MLVGYTDFDRDGDGDDHKSTFGYIFHFNLGPLIQYSKEQKVVSLSTIEEEYHGAINDGIGSMDLTTLGRAQVPYQSLDHSLL